MIRNLILPLLRGTSPVIACKKAITGLVLPRPWSFGTYFTAKTYLPNPYLF